MPPKGRAKKTKPKMSQCSHVKTVHPSLSWTLIKSKNQTQCVECGEKADELWLCLTCLHCYGSHSKGDDHSFLHVKAESHALAMNIETRRFWCYMCDCEVYRGSHNHPEFNIPEVGVIPIDWDSITPGWVCSRRPMKGLVGLRNIGNTCYMNSALQCLSNCPAMTSYFLRLAENDIYNIHKQRVATDYCKLIREMWCEQRQGYIAVPTDLLRSIQAKNPLFRGFMQQDTQELLRSLIDFLHEDLKTLVTFDPPYHAPPQTGSDQSSVSAQKYSSIIGDLFNGLIRSSVRCLYCDKVSVTKETFQDLSLPIPSGDQLLRLHNSNKSEGGHTASPNESSGNIQKSYNGRAVANYVVSWLIYPWSLISSITNSLSSYLSTETVTLDDCLSSFFSADPLTGDNMYSCEDCKKLRNGVKEVSILSLPEIMCIHLKRFRHDFMHSSKISSYVSFPVTSLNVAQYMKPGSTTGDETTLYNLTGVICHHGSVAGGHYTAFARHPATGDWYEYDDSYVTQVSVDTVRQCQAYVLFYSRDDTTQRHVRQKFESVARQPSSKDLLQFYVSKLWLLKMYTCTNPGPIGNSADFLCAHGHVRPACYDDIHDRVVAVSADSWQLIISRYGGGPAVNSLVKCETCETTLRQLKRRQEFECKEFGLQRAKVNNNLYALSTSWYRKWEQFIKAETDTPPGPIDNKPISVLDKSSARQSAKSERFKLRRSRAAYAEINGSTWRFLLSIYGGGPELISRESDELSDDSDEEGENIGGVIAQPATPTPSVLSESESEITSYTSTSVSELETDHIPLTTTANKQTAQSQAPPTSNVQSSQSQTFTSETKRVVKTRASKSDSNIGRISQQSKNSTESGKGRTPSPRLEEPTSDATSGYQTMSPKK